MDHNCERHPFEVASGTCRSCLGTFCPDCLLYPFGPDEEPYCKACAITAAGVRSTARNRRRVGVEPVVSGDRGKGRSGRLFGRRRRKQGPVDGAETLEEEPFEPLGDDEGSLLDARRLPSEPEEKPEPPPAPNIAPPAARDEEPELVHRAVPAEVAGGLDLGGVEDPGPGRFSPDIGGTDEATPVDAMSGLESVTADPTPVPPEPAVDLHVEPMAAATAADTYTADGTPLFTTDPPGPTVDDPLGNDPETTPPDDRTPVTEIETEPTDASPPEAESASPTQPEPATRPATGAPAPPTPAAEGSSPSATVPDDNPREQAAATDADTHELLRRIADLTRP